VGQKQQSFYLGITVLGANTMNKSPTPIRLQCSMMPCVIEPRNEPQPQEELYLYIAYTYSLTLGRRVVGVLHSKFATQG
jgi:hypothetical protein